MIDCGNAKYVILSMLKTFHISEKIKNFKNEKRVCPKRKNQRAKIRMNWPREK